MRGTRGLAAAAAVLAGLLGLLTWQVIAAGPLTAADMPVHHWVDSIGRDRSSPLWVPLSDLGDRRFGGPVLLAAAAVAVWRLRWRAVRPVLLAGAGLAVFSEVLAVMKTAVGRSDPDTGTNGVFEGGVEFPSGHTFGATVFWGLTAWLVVLAVRARRAGGAVDIRPSSSVNRYAFLAVGAVAGLMAAAAMLRMDYHWVSDVVGGWLLGMTALLTVGAAESVIRPLQSRSALLHRIYRPPGRVEFTPEPPRPGRSSPLPVSAGRADCASRPPRAHAAPRFPRL